MTGSAQDGVHHVAQRPFTPAATHRWTEDAARGVDRPLLTISPERAEAELRRALEREASERRGGRLLVIGPVIVLLWQLIGASFILVSAHTSSPVRGELLYSLSFAVGAAGGFFSVVVIYVAGAERGEWQGGEAQAGWRPGYFLSGR